MRKLFLALLVGTTALIQGGQAQVPTKEQCQQTDAQLNKVYQQLRGSLNDAQKQQLKQAQRDWIKKRDAFVASNPGNPQAALYQATMQRVNALQEVLQKIGGKQVSEKRNDSEGACAVQTHQRPPLQYDKIKPIYQEVNWDNPNIVAEALGKKFRAISIEGSNKIYVFDVKTKLLYGVIEMSVGMNSEMDPAEIICFSGNQTFIYSQKASDKGECFQFNEVPSLLTAYGQNTYRETVEGPFMDSNHNLGVCVHRLDPPNKYYFYPSTKIDMNSGNVGPINTQFLAKYPELASKLGEFSGNPIDQSAEPARDLVLDREGVCTVNKSNRKSEVFAETKSNNTLAANFIKNKIYLHQERNNQKSTVSIDLEDIGARNEPWNGPTIIRNSLLNGDLRGYGDVRSTNTQEGVSEGVKFSCYHDIAGETLSVQSNKDLKPISILPKLNEKTNPFTHKRYKAFHVVTSGNESSKANSLYVYCYPSAIVGFWVFPEKYAGEYELGVYNKNLGEWIAVQSNNRLQRSYSMIPSHYWDSQNGQMWLSSSNSIYQIDLNSGKSLQSYDIGKKFEVFALSDKRIFGMPRMDEHRGEIWNRDPIKKVCDILWSDDGNIMLYNDDGYYATKAKSFKSIAAKSGDSVYPFEQFDLKLNRPDIIFESLGFPKDQINLFKVAESKRLKRMGVTEEMLKPDFHLPELQIVGEVPASTPRDQLDLQIKATDDKYPLDRLRVYVNNVPVNGRDGELLRDQKTQSLEKTIPINFAAGRNKIQLSVLNSAGAESLYANAEVNCTAERPKPKLYAVALGVSQYDRPEWCLKYAAKDATDLIGKLKARAGSTYSEVKPLLLTDKEVTKESTAKIKEFLSGTTIDDTVLIFMAGHGLLDDKYDYYFGTTDIDPAKPSERGMPYEAIDNILAEVPSLRKALLMDTCHAGELDDDEKKELATSDGKGTLPAASSTATDSAIKGTVAMRAIGTRGMQVKAVEGAKGKSDWYEKLQDMFVDLRRGSGATVISSSQGAEYAFESSEQSNGLFTYALMEALDGKATSNKNGQITISAIGDYVKKRVQDLTKGKQNPNLRGVNLEEDFTLGMAK
jgi:uncharacterized caspase-like protein